MWKQSNNITNENLDQNNLESSNIRSNIQDLKTQNILEEKIEIIKNKSLLASTPPQRKSTSKLPFSPKSYRKSYK